MDEKEVGIIPLLQLIFHIKCKGIFANFCQLCQGSAMILKHQSVSHVILPDLLALISYNCRMVADAKMKQLARAML